MNLKTALSSFNRKERYWLLSNALGDLSSEMLLSSSFCDRIGLLLGMRVPADAWWGMDFHIDWLFAALILDSFGKEWQEPLINPRANGELSAVQKRLIRGTQEDFDFIVAFDRTIILIEAKGVTSWGNDQLARKCHRLQQWSDFASNSEKEGAKLKPLDVYLVLASPRRPQKLQRQSWPEFVRLQDGHPFFLPLDLSAAPETFLVPERCNERGKSDATGGWWHIRSASRPELEED